MSFVMSSDYVLVIVNATAFKGSGLTLLCLRRSPAVSGLEPKWSSFEGPFGLVWNRPLHGYMSSVLAAYPFACIYIYMYCMCIYIYVCIYIVHTYICIYIYGIYSI